MTHQRRSEPWSLFWKQCCQTWTRSSCCFVGRWWPQVSPLHRTSHEALSLSSSRCAPPHNHIYTPGGKYRKCVLIPQEKVTFAFLAQYLHRFLQSQTRQISEWSDKEPVPPAATHSFCLEDILWATPGWWGSRSAWWWTHHRQLLEEEESTGFSGRRAREAFTKHKLHNILVLVVS